MRHRYFKESPRRRAFLLAFIPAIFSALGTAASTTAGSAALAAGVGAGISAIDANQQRKGAADSAGRPKRRGLQKLQDELNAQLDRRQKALLALSQAQYERGSALRG